MLLPASGASELPDFLTEKSRIWARLISTLTPLHIMKKAIVSSLVLLALTAATFIAPPNPLAGRWQKKFHNGDVLMVNFRPDGTFDGFYNNKAFVSGKYTLKQDDFAMSDNSCNINYVGTYKLNFYSGTDSMRFTLVQDTCRSRSKGTAGLTMGRVKPVKP